jgi:hypothetical protein
MANPYFAELIIIGWQRDIARLVAEYADFTIISMIRNIGYRDRLVCMFVGNRNELVHFEFVINGVGPTLLSMYSDMDLSITNDPQDSHDLKIDSDCTTYLQTSSLDDIRKRFWSAPIWAIL